MGLEFKFQLLCSVLSDKQPPVRQGERLGKQEGEQEGRAGRVLTQTYWGLHTCQGRNFAAESKSEPLSWELFIPSLLPLLSNTESPHNGLHQPRKPFQFST